MGPDQTLKSRWNDRYDNGLGLVTRRYFHTVLDARERLQQKHAELAANNNFVRYRPRKRTEKCRDW